MQAFVLHVFTACDTTFVLHLSVLAVETRGYLEFRSIGSVEWEWEWLVNLRLCFVGLIVQVVRIKPAFSIREIRVSWATPRLALPMIRFV